MSEDDYIHLWGMLSGIIHIGAFRQYAESTFSYDNWSHGKGLAGVFALGIKLPIAIMYESAVAFKLIVIGEAAKHISNDLKEQAASIPWRKIIGTRDRLAHNPKIDRLMLDDITRNHLPMLEEQITALLRAIEAKHG